MKAQALVKPEIYFLRYAFPCSFITMQRGRLSESEMEELGAIARSGEFEGGAEELRARLERIFAPAFRRMRALADEKGASDVWDVALIREYFWNRHNEIIDAREEAYARAPEVLCELCKVRRGRVVETRGEDAAVVELDSGARRPVMTDLIQESLKIGDEVMVHYGYVAERI